MKTPAAIAGVLTLAGTVQLVLTPGPSWVPLLGAALLLSVAWVISLPLRNAGIIDIFWGPAIALIAWLAVLAYDRPVTAPTLVLLAMITLWAARLGLHLGRRNLGAPEDFRYARFREEASGRFWIQSLFTIFWLQAVLAWVVAAPVIGYASGTSAPFGAWQVAGAAAWLFGLAFEAVADEQLRRFKADPANRGKVLETGLWNRTRHPNYFGEAVLWWGIYLYTVGGGGAPYFVGTLLITWLLMRFSGVAMLEEGLSKSKPGYAEYVASTPAFFPRLTPR